MLRVLIGSQPVRAGWFGGTTVSTVTHGALIALAVVSSSIPSTNVEETRATEPERVTYIQTLPLVKPTMAARAGQASHAVRRAETSPARLDLSTIENTISSLEIPDFALPDLTAVNSGGLAVSDSIGAGVPSVAELVLAKSGITAPSDGVFTEEMVERAVEPRRGNPKPRYPSVLQSMGVEGDFMVKFVVDSTGTVREKEIEFPQSMHRLFVDAVKSALLKSRYLPATFAGRRVPQLVVQEFRFQSGNR